MKKQIVTMSLIKNLNKLMDFLEAFLDECKLESQARIDILVACEEAFSNIVNYAYAKKGEVKITCEFVEMDNEFRVTFTDQGRHFDPNSVEEVNTEAPLADRKPGRLGILLIKKLMDSMVYSFKDEENNLVLTKKTGINDEFEIKKEVNGEKTTLHISGKISAQKVQEFEEEINKVLIDKCNDLVLDFAQTSFVNSSGLRTLLKIHKRMSQFGGKLTVMNVSDEIMSSLKITGFLDIIEVKN